MPELKVWLCPVHQSLDDRGQLEPLDNCVACLRAERNELRESLVQAERLRGAASETESGKFPGEGERMMMNRHNHLEAGGTDFSQPMPADTPPFLPVLDTDCYVVAAQARRIEKLDQVLREAQKFADAARAKCDEKQVEIDRLRKALDWYADKANHENRYGGHNKTESDKSPEMKET